MGGGGGYYQQGNALVIANVDGVVSTVQDVYPINTGRPICGVDEQVVVDY